ncbi:MAG: hypothetical protein B7X09_04985 [Acidiphilium sp. 21-66-27]|nr:MAG: hypothetical protein B7X09_04985 [Acidiphilium sp. 21-66-27]
MQTRKTLVASSLLGLSCLALTGCGGPRLARKMQDFLGKPEAALVRVLGVPDRRSVNGDVVHDQYRRTITYSVPGWTGGPAFVDQRPAIGGIPPTVPPQTYKNTCVINFRIVHGLVQSYRATGPVC